MCGSPRGREVSSGRESTKMINKGCRTLAPATPKMRRLARSAWPYWLRHYGAGDAARFDFGVDRGVNRGQDSQSMAVSARPGRLATVQRCRLRSRRRPSIRRLHLPDRESRFSTSCPCPRARPYDVLRTGRLSNPRPNRDIRVLLLVLIHWICCMCHSRGLLVSPGTRDILRDGFLIGSRALPERSGGCGPGAADCSKTALVVASTQFSGRQDHRSRSHHPLS